MIIRWYLDIQEFDFFLQHILGKNNPVSDGFSRCVLNQMKLKDVQALDVQALAALLPAVPIPLAVFNTIAKVHNSRSGHHGAERTMRMLTFRNDAFQVLNRSIPFLRSHVKQFIAQCPCCQKMSMLKQPIHSHPFTTSRYYPMECLNIDFIGPFPDKGYVLVIIDTFTRWVELFPCKAANGVCAADSLYQHFGRFGAPTQIRSDRGSHFVNEVIKEFLSLMGTEHCMTLSYSSQENAIVERINKEINRHLRSFTFESNSVDDYRLALPIVQRILNSAYSDHTKVSAAQMLFGNALNLDRSVFLPAFERPDSMQALSTTASNMLRIKTKS